jgi:ketosteroid isomerase-like protein
MTTAREDIAKAYEGFEEAFFKGDAEAISRMYSENAELLIPEVPIITGREAIRQVWAKILGAGGNTVRVAMRQVEESGYWAYEVGTFEVKTPAGNILNAGKYIVIWKQQSTGDRKIHRDIFNWDVAPVALSSR